MSCQATAIPVLTVRLLFVTPEICSYTEHYAMMILTHITNLHLINLNRIYKLKQHFKWILIKVVRFARYPLRK